MEKGRIGRLYAIVFISSMLIILGCAGGKKLAKPFSGKPETGVEFYYTLNPDQSYNYTLQRNIVQNLEMQGRTVKTNLADTLQFTVQGKEVNDNSNLIMKLKIDSIYSIIEGMGGSQELNLSPLMETPFAIVLSPYGEELEFIGTDSLQKDVGPMAGGVIGVERFFQQIFPDLPQKSIKIGETWTENEIDTTLQSGLDVISDLDLEHTFKSVDTMNGYECVVIYTTGEGTIDGQGEQMGNKIALEGNMLELESTTYFAYKEGIFVKFDSKSIIEGTLAITGGMSMTLPMTMETESLVQLN